MEDLKKTEFLTPREKLRIYQGIQNKEEMYEKFFWREWDRLETRIKDLENKVDSILFVISNVRECKNKDRGSI